jgi:quercetin dioxygenase-like cupin family protein
MILQNRLVVAEMEMMAGSEPPRHVHEKEDELFIVHEGRMSVFRGTEIIEAGPGDSVWLPRNIAHHFTIHKASIKATFIATPGYTEHFFEAILLPMALWLRRRQSLIMFQYTAILCVRRR